MRQDLNEIKKVLDKHGYSINTIICDIMKKFNFKTICYKSGARKECGFSVSGVIAIMIMFPLMLLNSVHALYKSEYQKVTEMKKDVIYRLKNNEDMPWRVILYGMAKRFQVLVNPKREVVPNSAFVIDDTADCRVGYKIENITVVHDHTPNKKGSKFGFKHLLLVFFDGKSTTPLDFSTHKERKLGRKQQNKQYKKDCVKNSNGSKRRKECDIDKITNSLAMIKRAIKNGFMAKYVLADSWFTSQKFIQTIRAIKDGLIHVVAGIKNDRRKYSYNGQSINGKELIKTLQKEGKQKRCRKWNLRYFEVIVNYEGIGDVKLYICRFPYQKKWRIFISTDTKLNLVEMMEIYSVRWTIEVMFRELKQHLNFGKCKSRDFDAQIANITVSLILYIFLTYYRRMNAYETIGSLFELMKDEMCEKNLAQRIWQLFDELLQTVIEIISRSGRVDIVSFRQSPEYQYLKELFESSFLPNQISSVNKAV